MSDAKVTFARLDDMVASAGQEQTFSFDCPKRKHGRCESLIIRGRTNLREDPKGENGGIAQWAWDGNREAPTFAPSIVCGNCGWHGFIENGRTVDCQKKDEADPK